MPKTKVGDIEINYDIYGAGEPLLMIMGLGASSAQWDPELVQDLARSFRVITFDNRGTGQTDKPDAPYSIEMFADDAAGLLAKLEIPRAHIFGVSMGGMIAQEFALRHPAQTATLTLGCTTAGGKHSVPPPPESLKLLTAPREGVSPEDIIRRGWPLGYTAKYIAEHRDELESAIPRVLKHPTPIFAFKRQFEGTNTLRTWDRLPQIKAPTLVITGAQDVLIPAKNSEILAERIPGAKLHIIPNAGHNFMGETREEFAEAFVPFAKSHPIRADAPRETLAMPSLYDFALVCQSLSQTQSRLQMAETVGTFLAALDLDEAEIAARFLVGKALAQGEEKRLQVSGRAIWKIVAEITGTEDQGEDIFTAAADFGEAVEMMLKQRSSDPEPSLTIRALDAKFAEIADIEGRHARNRKLAALKELFELASALEGKYIAKILIREMRHGMSEGLMLEAIARMASKPVADVRRINMLEGDVGRVVRILRSPVTADTIEQPSGAISPPRNPRAVVKPLKPMLAHPSPTVADAFASIGSELALEHKVDGSRVQIHQLGSDGGVRIFSRRLNEITESLPEVVEMVSRLGDRRAIFDGEVIAVDVSGRPVAFQELMRRFGRTRKVERARSEQPIRLFLFDLLSLDGELCIDRPYTERIDAMNKLASTAGLESIGRVVRPALPEAEKFFDDACAAGFEGVMAKALTSAYTTGVRGRGWLKIKHVRTLDLAIIGAEWGYGRRHGWLSNYHLAARDEQNGGFSMIGKTFKGLTDDQFREMTEKLLALKIDESRGTVFVKPSIVVEVAYNDIQRSPVYDAGMALRFARIVRTRPDKSVDEADTIETVRADFERQLVKPVS